ncbi:MAG: protein phosphatase 2C domain-containing protein [Pseudomonadota bacterium]
MPKQVEASFQAASALSVGMRDHQEDAVVSDFPVGSDMGLVVLADGMGGHAAGDIASTIVMTEVYSELKFQSSAPEAMIGNINSVLLSAAANANDCLRDHVLENPGASGMGATLVAAVIYKSQLSWISIGDSPLYLFRDGVLKQLNEDHSMAPQIDFMVDSGLMDSEVGRDHPDRNCLTSVLAGDEIARIDCPAQPVDLVDGDILLVSSDGLQFLGDENIQSTLAKMSDAEANDIAGQFLEEIDELDDPYQDNVSMSVIKVHLNGVDSARVPTRPMYVAADTADATRGAGVSKMPQRIHLSNTANGTGTNGVGPMVLMHPLTSADRQK